MKKIIREDAPANNAGSGNIAGLGVGPDGEPGLTLTQQKKHKNKILRRSPQIVKNVPDWLIGKLKLARQNKKSVLEQYLRHYPLPEGIDEESGIILESISGIRISLKFK